MPCSIRRRRTRSNRAWSGLSGIRSGGGLRPLHPGAAGRRRRPCLRDGCRQATVTAFDAQGGGGQVWGETDLTPEDESDDLFGGGLAVDGGQNCSQPRRSGALSTALDAGSGQEIWQSKLGRRPCARRRRRAAVASSRSPSTTAPFWPPRMAAHLGPLLGVAQDAGLLGGCRAGGGRQCRHCRLHSGDLVAFDVISGRPLWTDSLAAAARGDAIATLADIRGLPVIDREVGSSPSPTAAPLPPSIVWRAAAASGTPASAAGRTPGWPAISSSC